MAGEAGNDTVDGDAGNDELAGGSGHDLLRGGGGRDRHVVAGGEGIDTVTDFGGVGRGAHPASVIVDEVDVLELSGAGLVARNMLLHQAGDELEITFEGVDGAKVVLRDFALENLDNLFEDLGNIQFDGQQRLENSFDVFDADAQRGRVFNPNTVTFLNDLARSIHAYTTFASLGRHGFARGESWGGAGGRSVLLTS